jgi:hypothetical protein
VISATAVWFRFAALLLAVMAIGFALGLYVLPYGLGWFAGALILTATGVLLIARKRLGGNWKPKSFSRVALAGTAGLCDSRKVFSNTLDGKLQESR